MSSRVVPVVWNKRPRIKYYLNDPGLEISQYDPETGTRISYVLLNREDVADLIDFVAHNMDNLKELPPEK